MAVLKTIQIDKALRKKGFEVSNKNHHFYYYMNNGKKTNIFTKTSHSSDEINDTLIKKMADQVRLEKNEFKELVQCTLSGERYREILIDKGIIKKGSN